MRHDTKETEASLVEVGLTLTEAKIYLAGLGLKTITIEELGKKTQIKRPTIYHAIGTLLAKGLVTQKRVGSKLTFTVAPPQTMRALVEEQKQKVEARANILNTLIPLLSEKQISDDAVSVAEYSGIEGMKLVMDIAFYCKSRTWDIIAPYQNFLREYDAEYAKRYLWARKYHGITSRTLWEDGMRTGRKLTKEEVSERNPRLMPWVMHGKFKSMMILFDDKIALFSSYEKLSAILITSKELNGMFEAMFEGLWEVSERY